MNVEDLDQLALKYEAAVAAVGRIESAGGYPSYPEEVRVFMALLAQKPWVDHGYDPGKVPAILDAVETATLEQLRCVLTAASRAERFCDGSWKATLENRELDPVFQRLRQLVFA